jgi:hypothetical protein
MNEKELAEMPAKEVLTLLRGQVDAAIGIVDAELLVRVVKGKDLCSGRPGNKKLLNFEVGDFQITARFTAPHD